MAKARLRRGIEIIKLANRIEALKMQEDDVEDVPGQADVPARATEAAGQALAHGAGKSSKRGLSTISTPAPAASATEGKGRLSRLARGAIFREVVLAKVREMKQEEERKKVEKTATEKARRAT
jgi:calcium/calmodulin-dependent protein kinase I